ncbi:MAG: membrane protein [Saprospiraceae bacterium]|nr:MAG: membrane protein [Saprospiraceae bacterium]
MKKLLLLMMAIVLVQAVNAQTKDFTKAGDSDPKAKAILDKVKQKYEGYKSIEAEFTIEMEFGEAPKEVQKGTIARKGDQYHLSLGTQEIISDNQSLWLIMHNNKSVQINNVPDEDEESLLTPQSLFNFYEKDNFVYTLTNEFVEAGRPVQEIEFKPLSKDADYAKLRLTVDKKTSDIVRIKAFGKDGSRFTFQIGKMNPNKSFSAGHFAFDKGKYAGYYVEDLR